MQRYNILMRLSLILHPARAAAMLGMGLSLALGLADAARADTTGGQGLRIVAVQPVYAAIAARIAGGNARITTLLTNPAQDAHDYEPTAAAARALADADIVILNGAGYDAWAEKIIAASPSATRHEIVLAALMHRGPGANPHLWFNPRAIPALAAALSVTLASAAPDQAAAVFERRDRLLSDLAPVLARIGALREQFIGVPVTASEPVAGELTDAIGLDMRNPALQAAIQNDNEPAPGDIAAMDADLRGGLVRVLILNTQHSGGITQHLRDLARQGGVPVVEVGEQQPAGLAAGHEYESWTMALLDRLEAALKAGPARAAARPGSAPILPASPAGAPPP